MFRSLKEICHEVNVKRHCDPGSLAEVRDGLRVCDDAVAGVGGRPEEVVHEPKPGA